MTEQIGNGTVSGLMAYLDQAIEKGWAPEGAVLPLKTAVKQVFSIDEGVDWEKAGARNVNLDDVFIRFSNKTLGKYSAQSLATYRSRVARALAWYESFLTNPGWTPKTRGAGRILGKGTVKKEANITAIVAEPMESNVDTRPFPEKDVKPMVPNLITYPFPLQSGELAYFYLPAKLTKGDADRMASFLATLVIES